MLQRLAFALVLPSFLLAVVTTQLPAKGPSRPVDGPGIFRVHCASCHGAEGRGDGPASAALKEKTPDLTRLADRNGGRFPAMHVRNTILLGSDSLFPIHGTKAMPIWGPIFHEIDEDQDLGNVRLENIVRYLEMMQKK